MTDQKKSGPDAQPDASSDQENKKGFSIRGILSWFVGAMLFISKFFTKAKFLSVLPDLITMGITMALTIWGFAKIGGWGFAIGLVVLILIHELGHFWFAKLMGISSSLPVFIPFVGAFVRLKRRPENVWKEFWLATGGPLIGGLAAFASHVVFVTTDNEYSTGLPMSVTF